MTCHEQLCPNYFTVNVFVLPVVFRQRFPKNQQFWLKLSVSGIYRRNTTASTEKFTENSLRRNFVLHFTFYLSIALSKILLHSKTIKNVKKLLVFSENDSRHLSNFLQIHI